MAERAFQLHSPQADTCAITRRHDENLALGNAGTHEQRPTCTSHRLAVALPGKIAILGAWFVFVLVSCLYDAPDPILELPAEQVQFDPDYISLDALKVSIV